MAGEFPFRLFPSGYPHLGIFLAVFGAIAGLHSLFTLGRAFGFASAGLHAAVQLHDRVGHGVWKGGATFYFKSIGAWDLLQAWKRVLRGSLFWFSSRPSSGLINRFSSDVWTVDYSLPFTLNIWITQVDNCQMRLQFLLLLRRLPSLEELPRYPLRILMQSSFFHHWCLSIFSYRCSIYYRCE